MDVLDWAGHPVSAGNAAWHLWNMSNRVSGVHLYARSSRKFIDDPAIAAGYPRLVEIAHRFQVLAEDAEALYAQLRDAADRYEPGLLEPADGIYVLHCRDDNPALTKKLHTIWREGSDCIHEAQELKVEVDRVLSNNSHG